MEEELLEHPQELLRTCAIASPAARLRAIRQRLAASHAEIGSTRVVTWVSAVEALARSLVVHAPGRPASTAEMRHRQYGAIGPVELVEEVLRLWGAPRGAEHFEREHWELFEVAAVYRDLVVHECCTIGHDRHPHLVAATEAVLRGLVELAALEARPRAIA